MVDRCLIMRSISGISQYGFNFLTKELEKYNLGGAHLYVLKIIYKHGEGLCQEDITKLSRVDKATTARNIKKLEDLDYIIRKPDHSDGRIHRIFLTQKGQDLEDIVNSKFKEWQNIVLNGLDRDEILIFEKVLKKMEQNILDFKEGNN